MDWSHQLNNIIHEPEPETVADAVALLLSILNSEQLSNIAAMQEDDLIDLHFTLGLAIRNAFGLHYPGSKLLVDCGTPPPDDGAGVVTFNLWKQLQAADENT